MKSVDSMKAMTTTMITIMGITNTSTTVCQQVLKICTLGVFDFKSRQSFNFHCKSNTWLIDMLQKGEMTPILLCLNILSMDIAISLGNVANTKKKSAQMF